MVAFFTQIFLDFFEKLSHPDNNNKEWFDQNRSTYTKEVRNPFKDFVFALSSKLKEFDEMIDPSPYIYRINNDLRFQPDKVPYKTHMSASFSPAGNAIAPAGYYIQISPTEIFLGGGMYEVATNLKNIVRDHIAENLEEFKNLYTTDKFTSYYSGISGNKNKRLPKHLQAVGEIEPLLFNTQWVYSTSLPYELILSDKLLDELIIRFQAIYPLNQFFRSALA